ncbi:MAG: DNRLRE domain-containing protein [Planctomycetota bacterium]
MVGSGIPNHSVDLTAADIVIALRDFFDDAEDGSDLTYTIEEGANGGGVVNVTFDGVAAELTLAPAADGSVEIVVRATDSGGRFVESSFTCEVDDGIETVMLGADRDNTLYDEGGLSNGAGNHFFVGKTAAMNGFAIRRGLIRFDLSSIPAGSTVLAARLVLNLSMSQSAAISVALHRVTRDWGEAGSQASPGGGTGPGSGEGGGATAETGDATWAAAILGTQAWDTAGGDFVGGSSAVATTAAGFNEWMSNGLLADLQGWVDTSVPNHGWILIGGESTDGSAKRFDTRENDTVANRPLLEVQYQE